MSNTPSRTPTIASWESWTTIISGLAGIVSFALDRPILAVIFTGLAIIVGWIYFFPRIRALKPIIGTAISFVTIVFSFTGGMFFSNFLNSSSNNSTVYGEEAFAVDSRKPWQATNFSAVRGDIIHIELSN